MEKLIRCCRYAIVPSPVQRFGDRESRLDSAKTLERLPRSAMPNMRSHDTKPRNIMGFIEIFQEKSVGEQSVEHTIKHRRGKMHVDLASLLRIVRECHREIVKADVPEYGSAVVERDLRPTALIASRRTVEQNLVLSNSRMQTQQNLAHRAGALDGTVEAGVSIGGRVTRARPGSQARASWVFLRVLKSD